MAKLTTTGRKRMPAKKFALPKEKKYPVNDKAHAANAKARAQQQHNKGNLSAAQLKKIDAAANKVLNKKAATKKKSSPKSSRKKK